MDRAIVGLGNPGPRFSGTRHNIGFAVVDALAGESASWRQPGDADALISELTLEGEDVLLVKPQSFMNRSGEVVAALARGHGLAPERLLVVHDELDLPLGTLRLKRSGGTAGHRGLSSIVDHLASDAFPRLRFGIGRPPAGCEVARFVLQPFTGDELGTVGTGVEKACTAAGDWVALGLDEAMGRVNLRAGLSRS